MDIIVINAAKYLFIIPVFLSLIFLYFQNTRIRKEIIKLAVIAFPISYLGAKILGKFYYSARPFVVENIKPLVAHAANNGFPSDHTLLTMTVAAIVFYFNKKVGLVLALLAILVGYARIAARIHHQIDIWGAVFVAIFAVFISAWILKKISKFKP